MKALYIYFAIGYTLLMGDETTHPIKLYCMYTPRFQTLYEEYFLPSVQDDFEIIAKIIPEECADGQFRSEGWHKTMLQKLELLCDAIEENWGNRVFFYSDIDIIFLRPILETALHTLGDRDFAVQQSWPRDKLCAGFFIIRGNEKTKRLFSIARDLLLEKRTIDDQVAIQAALRDYLGDDITWRFLPADQFPNGRRLLNMPRGRYTSDSQFTLPDGIRLFHATSCVGLENKYEFLSRVQMAYSLKRELK